MELARDVGNNCAGGLAGRAARDVLALGPNKLNPPPAHCNGTMTPPADSTRAGDVTGHGQGAVPAHALARAALPAEMSRKVRPIVSGKGVRSSRRKSMTGGPPYAPLRAARWRRHHRTQAARPEDARSQHHPTTLNCRSRPAAVESQCRVLRCGKVGPVRVVGGPPSNHRFFYSSRRITRAGQAMDHGGWSLVACDP